MPIRIPNDLPATKVLLDENIFVMTETRALRQDIRPLKILLLNLMPKKIETETQLSRLLGNTPLQVELEFMHTRTYQAKNVPSEHLFTFYKTFDEVKHRRFDGLIITGAPVEHLPFEAVDYWEELCSVMEWSKTNVHSTFHICWGAQAGLYYHYGIPKIPLPEKMFGIFPHKVDYPGSILFRGFDETFMVPHSRHTSVRASDIETVPGLKILSSSAEAGVYVIKSRGSRQIFVMGHSEYDRMTLHNEYLRDLAKGESIRMPVNYYPENDPARAPRLSWQAHANLLYSNWLNYNVYQTTPYNLDELPQEEEEERGPL